MTSCHKCQRTAQEVKILIWVKEYLGKDGNWGHQYHEYWCCFSCLSKLG